MLTPAHRQEALSRAYIQAIAAQAGLSFSLPSNDYGIDLTLNDVEIRGKRRVESGYRLDVQAKSTTQAAVGKTDVRYKMEVQAYEDLRTLKAGSPRILVVLVLPEDEREWCSQTEDQLILRRCAYWLNLQGRVATRNRKSVQVILPRQNIFSAQEVRNIMDRIKRGEMP
jgi:Domain of unknown function (DUF4365)